MLSNQCDQPLRYQLVHTDFSLHHGTFYGIVDDKRKGVGTRSQKRESEKMGRGRGRNQRRIKTKENHATVTKRRYVKETNGEE